MQKQVSDEQIDSLMRAVIADAAKDETFINEVADSPAIWWSVQREIAGRRPVSAMAWPPIAKFWQVLKFGVPALAALGLLVGIFVFRPTTNGTEYAGAQQNSSTQPAELPAAAHAEPAAPALSIPHTETAIFSPRSGSNRIPTRSAKHPGRSSIAANKPAASRPEIKTEFIALSYARDAESGQIVRVKVPSSMMVTLGLVSTVEKPANLVDAEVIVGDDGLTRAIRFIR